MSFLQENYSQELDKIIQELKEKGYKIITTSTDIKHKAFTVVYDKE